jgi:hypothetical protein
VIALAPPAANPFSAPRKPESERGPSLPSIRQSFLRPSQDLWTKRERAEQFRPPTANRSAPLAGLKASANGFGVTSPPAANRFQRPSQAAVSGPCCSGTATLQPPIVSAAPRRSIRPGRGRCGILHPPIVSASLPGRPRANPRDRGRRRTSIRQSFQRPSQGVPGRARNSALLPGGLRAPRCSCCQRAAMSCRQRDGSRSGGLAVSPTRGDGARGPLASVLIPPVGRHLAFAPWRWRVFPDRGPTRWQ